MVTGTSIVEAGPDLAGHDRVGWSGLRAREVQTQFGELLSATPLTAMDDEVVAAHELDAVAYGENADDAQRPDRPGSPAW